MSISCPYCRASISIRDPRLGRFKMRCPKCGLRSTLIVAGDPAAPSTTVEPIPGEGRPTPVVEPPSPSAMEDTVVDRAPEIPFPAQPELAPLPEDVRRRIGRFKTIGLMSESALARDLLAEDPWLGRRVVLRALRPALAADPVFVSRFVREAYASAQFEHPQFVKIHQFEPTDGVVCFAREYVDGSTLAEFRRFVHRLDAETVAACVLQVARGLKFAHDQGLVHRGLRPELLVLEPQLGMVRILDLGLTGSLGTRESGASGKGRGGDAAYRAESFVATSNYSAPEIEQDPARVDARADIYSLGKILHQLATGQAPGEEPKTPNEMPKALRELVSRMTAERRDDRPSSMADVIAALEQFLGVRTSGPFAPHAEQTARLDETIAYFRSGSIAKWRPTIVLGFHAAFGLFTMLFLLAGNLGGAIWIGSLWAATNLAYFGLRGMRGRDPLFSKFREWLAAGGRADWITLVAVVLLAAGVTTALGWLAPAIFLAVVAAGFAGGFYYGVDRPLADQRRTAVGHASELLRELRHQGFSEDAIRRFVRHRLGRNWEEFYEQLFGYDAMRLARDLARREGGARTARFAPWRDPIHDHLQTSLSTRRARADRDKLRAIEEAGGLAEGLNLVTARRRAWKSADAMIRAAHDIRESVKLARRDPDAIVVAPRAMADVIREAAARPDQTPEAAEPTESEPPLALRILEAVVGPRVRFLVGATLVGLCLIWAHQNGMFSAAEIREQVQSAVETGDVRKAAQVKTDFDKRDTKPLELAPLPAPVRARFNSWAPGAAGLILIVSSIAGGLGVAAVAISAALVPFLGEFVAIPKIGPLDGTLAASALGGALLLVGLFLTRKPR